ncbi:MAG: hypothetical protein LBP53_02735 [Candidatus Peribacteria bacterium]|nr:hypothetical protein [Candidatus Peribacteria bacterium]
MKQVSGRNITMQCILGVSSLLIGVSGRLVASLHSPTFSLRSEVLLF